MVPAERIHLQQSMCMRADHSRHSRFHNRNLKAPLLGRHLGSNHYFPATIDHAYTSWSTCQEP